MPPYIIPDYSRDIPDDVEGGYNVTSPWKNQLRRQAIRETLGSMGDSDPAQASETIDLTQRDLLGNANAPVRWQGGREFAQQIDPKIRRQIVDEVTGDDSFAPKPMTATFGGKNFTMTPGRSISQNVANAINARQMKQMEIDKQLAAIQGQRDFELKKAAIPGDQEANRFKMAAELEDKRYQREHPAWQQENAQKMAGLGLQKAEREASGVLSPQEIRAQRQQAVSTLLPILAAQQTPDATAMIAKLAGGLEGVTPDIAAGFGQAFKPKPVTAGDPAEIFARGKAKARAFGEQDASTFGWDPTQQDVQGLVAQRDQMAQAILAQKPGVTPEAAKAEATAMLEAELDPNANDINAGWIPEARTALRR